MTRRHIIDLLLTGATGLPACAPPKVGILARLNRIAASEELAIVDTLTPEVMTVIGANVGRFVLPEPPGRLSIAPDGVWAAWFPYSSNVYPEGTEGPLVYFTDHRESARTLRLKGRFGAQLAISSKGERLAVALVVAAGPVTRLLVLKLATGEVEYDLTDLLTRFSPAKVERLRLSAGGNRLAAGSRNLFSVVDLPSRTVLFEGAGRFPSLSPSGEAVAFVDERRKLSLTTIATGATRRLLGWSAVHGSGPGPRTAHSFSQASRGRHPSFGIWPRSTAKRMPMRRSHALRSMTSGRSAHSSSGGC